MNGTTSSALLLSAAVCATTCCAAAEDGSAFTSLGAIRIGSTTLPRLQRSLGEVQVVHSGEAGETLYTICYRVGERVVLFMSGELGGPARDLGGIRISTATERLPCRTPSASRQLSKVEIGGIELGNSPSRVRSRLGVPVETEEGILTRTFATKRPMTPREQRRLPAEARRMIRSGELKPEFDVFVSVRVRFHDNQATEIEVWKAETW